MQTTLLGLAIAVIVAIVAALVAPLVVDWNHYRSAFETEVGRLTGLDVQVGGIEARILPTPRIELRDIEIGAAGRGSRLRAQALDLELRLGPLFRGRIEASQARLVAPQFTLALDPAGALTLPAALPSFRPEQLSVSSLSVADGSLVLADAATGTHLVLRDLSFDGDVRSLVGPFSGEGSFAVGGEPYRYRIAGSRTDGVGALKLRLNVDPQNHPLSTTLEGALTLDGGVPQFAGTLALERPVGAALSGGQRVLSDPWHATASLAATPASATVKDIAFQYGPDERAINIAGKADLTFGAVPHFHGELRALQVDVDRALAAPDLTHRPPLVLVRDFATAFAGAAKLPMPGDIAVSVDGLNAGGAAITSLRGTVRFDDNGWQLDGFDLHAPGLTGITLSGRLTGSVQGAAFTGPAALESGDADALIAWLGGRSGGPSGRMSTLSARGDVTLAGDRLAVQGLTAKLDQETVSGSAAYTWPAQDRPAAVDADLHATSLDLDALADFAGAAFNQDGFEMPRAGALALDVGQATLAGINARALKGQVKFDAGALQIEHLTIGDLAGAALDVSGRIDALSSQPRGRISVALDARTLAGFAPLVGKVAPGVGAVLRQSADRLAPSMLQATLTFDPAAAGSTASLDLKGRLGLLRLSLNADATGDVAHPADASVHIDGALDADDGTTLTALFGIGRFVGVDQLPGRFTFSAQGPLGGALQAKSELAASGFDATAAGTLHVAADAPPQGTMQVQVAAADLRPLMQVMTGQQSAAVPVSARAALAMSGADLSFTQIAAAVGKSSVNGRLALTLGSPMGIDGDLQTDTADATGIMAMLLGLPRASGGNEPWSGAAVSAGAFSALNGAVTFKIEKAAVPSLTASALSGVVRFQPPNITFDNVDGTVAGGHATAQLAFRRNADGLVSHGHIELADADAATLLQADKKTVDGKVSLKLDGDSIGANLAAIIRTLHGGGSVGIADARFVGLDPAVFAAAERAADQANVTDAAKILPAVNAALANGSLTIAQGDAPVTITGGKAGVANVSLAGQDGSTLAVAGSFDFSSGAIDTRVTLAASPPPHALIRARPELAIALKGPLAAPARALDVSALSGWLALRAAELQTRRLESLEANRRREVIGLAIRPAFPVVRLAARGALVESGIVLNVLPPSARQLDLLKPESASDPAAAGVSKPPAPRPVPSPAAPRTAGSDKRSPLDLLFRPQN